MYSFIYRKKLPLSGVSNNTGVVDSDPQADQNVFSGPIFVVKLQWHIVFLPYLSLNGEQCFRSGSLDLHL